MFLCLSFFFFFFSYRNAFLYFNEKALVNSNFATNLALVFSSKSLNLISNSNKFRQEMINVLQQNFIRTSLIKKKTKYISIKKLVMCIEKQVFNN